MKEPDFYLASSEGYDLGEPRRCWTIKRVSVVNKDGLLISVDPPLIGQKYGLGEHDIRVLLVVSRHEGQSLVPIKNWPVFVHVARLLVAAPEKRATIQLNELEAIAWAELYRTEQDAKQKGLR